MGQEIESKFRRMKNLFITLTCLLCCVHAYPSVNLFGGQLSYEHLGNQVYNFYLDVYYDCNGDTLGSDTLYVKRISANGSLVGTTALVLGTRSTPVDISKYLDSCKGMSTCNGGNVPYGFLSQRITYQIDFTNDTGCSIFAYTYPGNWFSGLTHGIANTPAYFSTELNRCSYENSSPVIEAGPQVIMDLGNRAFRSFNAYDADGDSLSYHNVQNPVTPNFSGSALPFPHNTNPNFLQLSGFRLDPVSGHFSFKPLTLNFQGVASVQVKEWRKINGTYQLISHTIRSQYLYCTQTTAAVNDLPTVVPIRLCDGTTVRDTLSINADSNQHVRIKVIRSISNAIIQIDTGQFQQQAVIDFVGDSGSTEKRKEFLVVNYIVEDCPIIQEYQVVYTVDFLPSAKGSVTFTESSCGLITSSPLVIDQVNNTVWILKDSASSIEQLIQLDSVRMDPGTYYSRYTFRHQNPQYCSDVHLDTFRVAGYTQAKLEPSDTSLCYGENLTLLALDTLVSATYEWTFDNSTLPDSQHVMTWKALSNGLLKMRAVDGQGCESMDSIQVALYQLPNPYLGGDTAFCGSAGFDLTPAQHGDWKYIWSTGDTTPSIQVDQSGIYWLNIMDTNSCMNRDSIELTFYNGVQADLGPDRTSCPGFSVRLGDSLPTGLLYFWSDGYQARTRQTDTAGVFHIRVLDTDGCEAFDTVEVTYYAIQPLSLGADSVLMCTGDSIKVDPGNWNLVNWTDNHGSAVRWIRSAGNYGVHVVDQNGCEQRDSMLIELHLAEVKIMGDTFVCQGGSATLSVLNQYDSILWNTGSQDTMITVDSSGLYRVWVIDTLGCQAEITLSIATRQAPSPDYIVDELADRKVQFTAVEGMQSYLWYFGDGDSSDQRAPLHQYPQNGTYTVNLEAIDSFGCQGSGPQSVVFINLGITEKKRDFLVYPNPSHGSITIQWTGELDGIYVHNQLGQLIEVLEIQPGSDKQTITLPSGTYLLRSKDGVFLTRIVILE